MFNAYDERALDAVANILADAEVMHRQASRVAADPGLSARLSERRDRLRELNDLISPSKGAGNGSVFRLMDQLRLAIDATFGDDDQAATVASSDAKGKVMAVVEDCLASRELSANARNVLEEVRFCVGGSASDTQAFEGFRALPD